MKREIVRPIGAALAALGFWGSLLSAAPAAAQDEAEQIPWYMPQPWVHPPMTGPKIRKLPGYYGHNYRNRSYGGFGNGCYGDCRELPGTVSTGYGVVLAQPVVAIFDPDNYQIVPRAGYETQQSVEAPRRPDPVQPAVVSVDIPSKLREAQPTYSTQNGVRIFRPAPVAEY